MLFGPLLIIESVLYGRILHSYFSEHDMPLDIVAGYNISDFRESLNPTKVDDEERVSFFCSDDSKCDWVIDGNKIRFNIIINIDEEGNRSIYSYLLQRLENSLPQYIFS